MTTAPTRPIRHRAGRTAILSLAALVTAGGMWGVAAGPAGLAGAAGSSSRHTAVKATETDFRIALSKHSFNPGTYTFVTVNKGQVTHNLEITGPGVAKSLTKNIEPGQSTKLTVTLKKGAYDVFCAIPGHKALGMNVNVRVGHAN